MHRAVRPAAARRWLAVVAAAFALALGGCRTLPSARVDLSGQPPAAAALAKANLEVFDAVWDLVHRKHYDPRLGGVDWAAAAATFAPRAAAAPDPKALYAVLNEMLAPLNDSHTLALSPERRSERRTAARARTGFNLLQVEGRWVVAEVVPGSPAEEAGVKPGWIAVARNGRPLGPRTEFGAKEGETVTWEFLDAEDRTVTVSPAARRLSTVAPPTARVLPGGFVYVRFDEFDGPGRRWLGRQLEEHRAAPGVVIDLRRNPGGETFSLGISIGEFFDRAVDCGTFVTRGGRRSLKRSWQLGSANYGGKVVVLVDGATGSAAEIFAAVLQDHGRAVVVGRRTAGAVLASWFYRLPDGGELQLSREDYLAPKGRRLEGRGLEPDLAVVRTLADARRAIDRDLETALAVLRGELAVPATAR